MNLSFDLVDFLSYFYALIVNIRSELDHFFLMTLNKLLQNFFLLLLNCFYFVYFLHDFFSKIIGLVLDQLELFHYKLSKIVTWFSFLWRNSRFGFSNFLK